MKKYVDVIVPLPIAGQYTYSLPAEMEEKVQIGCRVVVPFGRKKFYTAIVTNVHYAAPEGYETKDIEEVPHASSVCLIQLLYCCLNSLNFGSGWLLIISVHWEMFIRLPFRPA